MTTIRSRKVRRILRLEGKAGRQATREARATVRALLLRRRVDALRREARALETSLDGAQRAELARARTCLAPPLLPPPARRARRRADDDARCPVMHGEAAPNGAELAPQHQEA